MRYYKYVCMCFVYTEQFTYTRLDLGEGEVPGGSHHLAWWQTYHLDSWGKIHYI